MKAAHTLISLMRGIGPAPSGHQVLPYDTVNGATGEPAAERGSPEQRVQDRVDEPRL